MEEGTGLFQSLSTKGFALRLTINNCKADWLTDLIRDCLIDLFSYQFIDGSFDFQGVWLIVWCYEWKTDWLIEWLTVSVIDWLTDLLIGWLTNWLMIGHQWTKQELANRLTYIWINWLIEWLTHWLIDWFTRLVRSQF